MLRIIILCCTVVWASLTPLAAQVTSPVRSPVLTVDSERLYQGSAFGQRVARDLEVQGEALSAENRKIEAELEAEELSLTEQRKTLTPEEFRALADAFDEKVQTTRRRQLAKTQALNKQLEDQQIVFLQAAAPVLEALMRESGAAIVIERRDVFLSADAIDITASAITRIDATLGEGPSSTNSSD